MINRVFPKEDFIQFYYMFITNLLCNLIYQFLIYTTDAAGLGVLCRCMLMSFEQELSC